MREPLSSQPQKSPLLEKTRQLLQTKDLSIPTEKVCLALKEHSTPDDTRPVHAGIPGGGER